MNKDDVSYGFLTHPLVQIVTLLRFLAALFILVSPLWGFILSMILDILDAQILIHIIGITRSQYHVWDKVVDWFAYIVEFLVAIGYGLYMPFLLLLFWRFAGQFMFMRTERTIYFAFFPNFFDMAFVWLILFYPVIQHVDLAKPQPWEWLGVLFIAKLLHEFGMHFLWPRLLLPHVEDLTQGFWNRILGKK